MPGLRLVYHPWLSLPSVSKCKLLNIGGAQGFEHNSEPQGSVQAEIAQTPPPRCATASTTMAKMEPWCLPDKGGTKPK